MGHMRLRLYKSSHPYLGFLSMDGPFISCLPAREARTEKKMS